MKKNSLIKIIVCSFLSIITVSCSVSFGDYENPKSSGVEIKTDAPKEIKDRAFAFAELYRDSETEYGWGGQDPVRSIKVDCSGLVVMCYKYALVDTKYSLLFDDSNCADMCSKYSTPTTKPEHGDLIFMGAVDSPEISHMAIYDREDEDGNIHFIDSTERQKDSVWSKDVNGVTERYYHKTNGRIKSYGVMKVKYTER